MKKLYLFALISAALISGCSTTNIQNQYTDIKAPLDKRYYHVDIPTHDGLRLKATVFQPELAPGETAPVIISTHGFGAFRMPRPVSIYGTMIITGKASLAAWHNKYWVVSYDQRGFGDSDGDVQLMDPAFEVKDASSVVDWIEQYLPRISKDSNGGTAIGMIGESYGGGVQLLTSIHDDRIDTIVPITTWYDLSSSLAPNDQVKIIWGRMLFSFGGINSGFDFPKAFEKPYLELLKGRITPEAKQELAIRSPAHYCDNGQYPQASMLLLQGFRDSIFTINQGMSNQECGLKGGNDARLIAIQDGHILPWPVQSFSGMPMYNTQPAITCGENKYQTIDMIIQWYNLKLKGIPEPEPIPEICITFSDDDGMVASQIPTGGDRFSFNDVRISLNKSGWFEVIMEPLDKLAGVFIPAGKTPTAEDQEIKGGTFRPAFIPLKVMDANGYIAGIPTADIQMETTTNKKDSVIFAAIGVRKPGSPYIHILGEQYTPITGAGQHQIELAAVSSRLQTGDTVGLILQGFSGQYGIFRNGWFSSATLSGSLGLPLSSTLKSSITAKVNTQQEHQ